MDWRDEGILVSVRRHGESHAIVEVFTRAHGRHAGVVRGGGSRKVAPFLQPGSQVEAEWSARLEEHIGNFRIDPVRVRVGLMADGAALAALASMAGLLSAALPERAAHPDLYAATVELLDALDGRADWAGVYARWEIAMLRELGFGLDLSCCAVSGATEGLAYVSPKSGRAVSREGAGDWAERLLPLPGFLLSGERPASGVEVADALALSGFFLERWLAPTLGRGKLPASRGRAVAAILARGRD